MHFCSDSRGEEGGAGRHAPLGCTRRRVAAAVSGEKQAPDAASDKGLLTSDGRLAVVFGAWRHGCAASWLRGVCAIQSSPYTLINLNAGCTKTTRATHHAQLASLLLQRMRVKVDRVHKFSSTLGVAACVVEGAGKKKKPRPHYWCAAAALLGGETAVYVKSAN